MNKDRLEELLNACIGYLSELKEYETPEEIQFFWQNIIGLTSEEMKYLGICEK